MNQTTFWTITSGSWRSRAQHWRPGLLRCTWGGGRRRRAPGPSDQPRPRARHLTDLNQWANNQIEQGCLFFFVYFQQRGNI